MKMKRILSILVALAMIISVVPSVFAGTPGIDIDFNAEDSRFTGWKSYTPSRPTRGYETNVYGKAADDSSMYISAQSTSTSQSPITAREALTLTKSGTRVSFKIATPDKNRVKAVSFGDGVEQTHSTTLFKLDTDGKMYIFDTELCDYATERWYQVDIEFNSLGQYKVYVDGGLTAKVTNGTTSATMSDLFGEETDDAEERNIFAYMQDKNSGKASKVYFDDFETEIASGPSDIPTIPDNRKIDITYVGEGNFANGKLSGVTETDTVESILADFNVVTGTVKVVNSLGEQVTEGTIVHGMMLEMASADGSTKVRYIIDCLNLELHMDSTDTKESTRDVSVTFNGSASFAGSVEFYLNDEKVFTDTEAPYEYTVTHVTEDEYEVYAVVVSGDERTSTEKKSYNYASNVVPTIAIVDNIGNVFDYGAVGTDETISINVSATDNDGGVESVKLYFDGVIVAENSAASNYPLTMTLTSDYVKTGIARGKHTIYAVAIDSDGAVNTSDVITISSVNRSISIIDEATFDEGNVTIWPGDETNATIIDDGNGNRVQKWEPSAGTQAASIITSVSQFMQGTVYYEIDFSLSDVTAATNLIAIRDAHVDAYDCVRIKEGKLYGGSEFSAPPESGYATILPDTWYRLKYSFNITTDKKSIEISSDGGATYTSVVKNEPMETIGTCASIRMVFNQQYSAYTYVSPNYVAFVDNVKLYTMNESLYMTGTYFVNESGMDVEAGGKVGTDLKKIQFTFSQEVPTVAIEKENFELVDSKGNKFTEFDLTISSNIVSLVLDSALLSRESYTIRTKNMDSKYASVFPAEMVFTTDLADFDVTSLVTKVNGSVATSLSNIATGDTLSATMAVQNNSNAPKNAILIYAIYSGGDKLIGISKTPVSIPIGGATVTTEDAAIYGTIDGTVTTRALFWSDMSSTRTIEMREVE